MLLVLLCAYYNNDDGLQCLHDSVPGAEKLKL